MPYQNPPCALSYKSKDKETKFKPQKPLKNSSLATCFSNIGFPSNRDLTTP